MSADAGAGRDAGDQYGNTPGYRNTEVLKV